MKRSSLAVVIGVVVLLLAFAAPAAAHNMVVDPPGEGPTVQHWVGGLHVPADGEGLFHTPFGNLPAGHLQGLPEACSATNNNPSAVTFLAPPFGSCQHGQR